MLLRMGRYWEVRTTHGTLGDVTLDVNLLVTTPELDDSPGKSLEADRTLVHYENDRKKSVRSGSIFAISQLNCKMDNSKRQDKRDSAKKSREFSIYTKKAVRAYENKKKSLIVVVGDEQTMRPGKGGISSGRTAPDRPDGDSVR